MRTVLTAEDIRKPANRRYQRDILAFIEEHDQSGDDCLAIAHEPQNGYVADVLTFTFYDRDGDGQLQADTETGGPKAFSVQVDLRDELPPWWSQLAQEAP